MPFMVGEVVTPPSDAVLAHSIEAAAQRHGGRDAAVLARVLVSVAYHESRYRLDAVNKKSGAAGAFQILPHIASAHNVNPFNPAQAADLAARMLTRWRVKYRGSWAHALAAYVWGPAHVDRVRRGETSDWPARVHRYVERVLDGAGLPRPFRIHIAGVGWS